jgi:hypothetical protein
MQTEHATVVCVCNPKYLGGLLFKVSPGKKFVKPYYNQLLAPWFALVIPALREMKKKYYGPGTPGE